MNLSTHQEQLLQPAVAVAGAKKASNNEKYGVGVEIFGVCVCGENVQ